MPNNSPTAVLELSATELTMPENEVQYSLASSYDTDKDGNKVQRDFKYAISVDGAQVDTAVSGSIILPEGVSVITGTVIDKRGASGTAIENVLVKPAKPPFEPTDFGAKVVGLTTAEEITVCKELNGKLLRHAVELTSWNGGRIKALDEILDSGLQLALNINWEPAGSPRKFPTDMVTYEDLLSSLLDMYKPEVAVCENEATTDQFYADVIENYLTEYKSFVKICNSKGVKCTDSGIAVEWVNTIASGGKLRQNGTDTATQITAFKDIPCSFVNFHFAVKGSVIPDLKKAADYIRQVTGKQVMSNEHHYENSNADTAQKVCAQAQAAGFRYLVVWGAGNGSGGDPLNNGTALTPLGQGFAAGALVKQ